MSERFTAEVAGWYQVTAWIAAPDDDAPRILNAVYEGDPYKDPEHARLVYGDDVLACLGPTGT